MSQEKTKLSRADRKQIEAAIAKAKNTDKRHKSAQDSIPFQRMFPDGICRVTDDTFLSQRSLWRCRFFCHCSSSLIMTCSICCGV